VSERRPPKQVGSKIAGCDEELRCTRRVLRGIGGLLVRSEVKE
jgi:hypothetical protein